MKRFSTGLLLLVAAGAALAGDQERRSLGDHLRLPEQVTRSAELPQRGSSMDRVRERWGEPRQRLGAVGEPPISRWVYDGFSVYFEHRYVIHSVQGAGGG